MKNVFIFPKLYSLKKVFHLEKKQLNDMQGLVELLKCEKFPREFNRGGTWSYKVRAKCRALFSATLIKQFLRESSGTSFLHYWIKIDSEVVKPVKRGHYIPNKRYILMFCDPVNEIEQIPKDKPNITWTEMNVCSYQVASYYTDNLKQPDLLNPETCEYFFILRN